jgi:hypothetical protein
MKQDEQTQAQHQGREYDWDVDQSIDKPSAWEGIPGQQVTERRANPDGKNSSNGARKNRQSEGCANFRLCQSFVKISRRSEHDIGRKQQNNEQDKAS